ncbi:hypothetical protein ALC62_12339 [Cyphomyrmex costatus]|uniref:Uncharacterized protein n=1 Tax=Cyphomyrmex costatus TaxID=456900 RepID=A0A151IBD2_9HYME|nr:hypothetical protein ALC62_12339 [Cyphomyrmex costatus]
MAFSHIVNAAKQTARGGKNERRRRARSAEIVYFSLAKRRKIKGKQETTARDGGNQAGLHPEMDFPGTSKNNRLKRCISSCRYPQSLTSSSKKYRTAPGLAETASGADIGIEGAESAVRSEKPTDLNGVRDAKEKRFPRGSVPSLSLFLSLIHSKTGVEPREEGWRAEGMHNQERCSLLEM